MVNIIKYAAYWQAHGLMEDNLYFFPYVRYVNCRFHIFDIQLPPLTPNSFFCFSNHLVTVFFFFLLLSLPLSVL